MAAMMPHLDEPFQDDVSLAASEDDFTLRRSPLFDLPSQHSGFKSEHDMSEADDRSSNNAPWSPPGFRGLSNRSSWLGHDPYSRMPHLRPSMSPSRSRHTSPEYQDAMEGDNDVTLAASIPLPPGTDSPMKGRSPEPEEPFDNISRAFEHKQHTDQNHNNFIRFAVQAEVQHREPFAAFASMVKDKLDRATSSRRSTLFSILVVLGSLFLARLIVTPPTPPPAPDLLKLSALAKSFEPLIFYSEHGHGQIVALQQTSVAVWDLGESVRASGIDSAPIIKSSLDELSDSLRDLGEQLTQFFASVDSDVDGILIVMDWAKRSLTGLSESQDTGISTFVYDRLHGLLNRGGLLESERGLTPLGKLLSDVFGSSSPQRTRATMTRSFYEFLSVLEETIDNELTHSAALFALFGRIDGQFLNLQRTVARESDTQDRLESDLLSSMWTRVIGANAAVLHKFDKNKQLLATLRSRTVNNKHLIMEHHGRLQNLKANLESLRRKLVSPLVRRNDSVSLDNVSVIEQQVHGLEATHDYLKQVRDKQKSKMMEMVYAAGSGHGLIGGVGGPAIDAH